MKLNFFLFFCITLLKNPAESCPDGFHQMPVANCPETRCYEFYEAGQTFQQNREEIQAFCSGQANNNFNGMGGLLEFRTMDEFNRVRQILQSTQPAIPYLTSLMYNPGGTLVYVNGANTRSASGTVNTSLPLTGDPNTCVGIGVTGGSIDLVVVECDTPQPYICDLTLAGISAPMLTGDDFRYVGPDGQITLRCEFTASNAIVDVVWLRDGVDVTTQFDSGSYTITQSPTTSSDLVFTSFDGSKHAGAYQCSLSARLGSLLSKRVSVLSAVPPAIQNGTLDISAPERSIAFFSCLANSSVVPRPSVTWFKDGAVLDISDSTKYLVNTRSGRLFISNVMAADEGVYTCQLENIAGMFTSNPGGRLTVNSETDLVPEYLLQPNVDTKIIKILRGGDLTVECVAKTSHPDVNYVWTVPNGGSSFTSLTYAYHNRGTSPIIPAYFGNHVETNIDLDQAGMYTVQVRLQGINASDPVGVVNAKTNGVVEVQVQTFPTITSLDNSQTVEPARATTLTCENTGIPTPNVVWFKNGTVIQNNADYIVSGNQLTISNIQPDDLTSFQCLVFNEVGMAIKDLFLCGRNGVPGLVTVEVEPFTTTSVRIRWDPPTQPNDDIELLTYDVYFTQRGTSSSKTFDITSLSPQETRAWNERSFIIEQLSLDDSVVAVVVARSPQGEGARPSPEQAAVGFTFGEAPTQAPSNFAITRLDSGRVQMTWDPLESPRGVDHDITYYRIEYRLTRTDTQNPQTIVHDTSSNDPSTIIDIPQDNAAMQVVEARVQGVTQIRREPDAFSFGPFSDYETEDNKPTPSPPPQDNKTTPSPPPQDNKTTPSPPPPPLDSLPIILGTVFGIVVIICPPIVILITIVVFRKYKSTRALPHAESEVVYEEILDPSEYGKSDKLKVELTDNPAYVFKSTDKEVTQDQQHNSTYYNL